MNRVSETVKQTETGAGDRVRFSGCTLCPRRCGADREGGGSVFELEFSLFETEETP